MFLGIDGGGTRCRARLVDARGRLLGEGAAGSANLGLGIDVAATAILAAADAAFARAGLDSSARGEARAGFGVAGANVASLAAALARHAFPFATTVVASDAVAACLGAHGGRDGGILILGTGSQGLVIADGRSKTIGGWGFAVGDDASGAALGRSLIRAAILAFDGLGPRSPLTDGVMAGFEDDPSNAVVWSKSATPRDYGRHAPALFDAAASADPVAVSLLREAAAQVDTMLARLTDLGASRIALMGGLAHPYVPWLAPRSRAVLVEPEGDALDGAIRLARDGAPR